jgi:Protein of unknown function (DUF3800)
LGRRIVPVSFVAYIDESGDTGLESVKPINERGASEWLVLSCFLVRAVNDLKLPEWVRGIQTKFKNVQSPHLHFGDLLPFKRLIACETLAQNPCRAFVAMSNKKNIQRYRNPNLNPNNKAWIYWWLARLLLERVTKFCERVIPFEDRGEQKLRIVFSRRTDLKYKDFEDYLWKLRWQSYFGELVLDAGDISWAVVDFDEIRVLDHAARSGLQLADVVSGAFFQAVERNRPADCDPSYANVLAPIMARDTWGRTIGFGIKAMPDLQAMGLADEQKKVFEFYGQKEWQPPGS